MLGIISIAILVIIIISISIFTIMIIIGGKANKSQEEQILEDKEQMEYLRNYKKDS